MERGDNAARPRKPASPKTMKGHAHPTMKPTALAHKAETDKAATTRRARGESHDWNDCGAWPGSGGTTREFSINIGPNQKWGT